MKSDDSAGSTYDEPPLAAVRAFTIHSDFPFTSSVLPEAGNAPGQ